MYVKNKYVKLATLVEGKLKATFFNSYSTKRRYSFS